MSSGGASIQIRRLTATETTSSIVIFMTLLVMLVSLLTAPFGWRMPASTPDVVLLIGVGISGGLGQIFFTDSYRFAPASFLAPFDYTAMLWAFLLGYWFFGEVPTLYVVIGAVVVAGAGIFVILRERYLGLKRLRRYAGRCHCHHRGRAEEGPSTRRCFAKSHFLKPEPDQNALKVMMV